MERILNYSGLCVSSASGSGGKTLFSLGLGRALYRRGYIVQPFKKGPDYIDAAWLGAACHFQASNLDPFFQDQQGLRQTFRQALLRAFSPDRPLFTLLEGNRGLFDGLDEFGSCSTANVARVLKLPVLLCLNAAKMTRTMAALLQGLVNFEENLDFCGLVLNNTGSARHEAALIKSIDYHVGLPVLGCIPRLKENPLPERHMGLASRGGDQELEVDGNLDRLAALVENCCDINKILAGAGSFSDYASDVAQPASPGLTRNSPAIGYVHDGAFWFYYPENLQALENAGARLVRLSLLEDWSAENYQNLSGLYLGGGFPEDYAEKLSSSPALAFLAERARAGMPIYAECGGLALLANELKIAGKCWPMAGVFPISLALHEKPQGLGYVEGEICLPNPYYPLNAKLRGHEFHYTGCLSHDNGLPTALRLKRGQGLAPARKRLDGLVYKNVWASYTHIFAPAESDWARNFVSAAANWQKGREGDSTSGEKHG